MLVVFVGFRVKWVVRWVGGEGRYKAW